jgi:prophage regulatory protein
MQIIRREAVERLTGLKRSTIYEMIAKGAFPKQVRLTAHAVGWPLAEVEMWINTRVEARQQEAA